MWLEPGKTYHTFETLLTAALKHLNCGFALENFSLHLRNAMGIFASRKRWKLEVQETYTRDCCSLLFKKEKTVTICVPVKLYGTYICLQEMVFVGTKHLSVTLLFMAILSQLPLIPL